MKVAFALVLCFTAGGIAQPTETSWLDRPLTNWNAPTKPLSRAKPSGESIVEVAKRCKLQVRRDTPAQRALAEAGWLPYLHVDREIVRRDIEIVAGMAEADGMCRPMDFNVFVFVGGELAGTLSPLPMASRGDGEIGAVRLADNGTISAEFSRYADRDALCCPSGHVRVRYHIDQNGPRAVVVPVSMQVTRP